MRILSVGISGDEGGGQVVRELVNESLRERGYQITEVDFEDTHPAVPSLSAIRYLRRHQHFDVVHCHGMVGSHAFGTVIGGQLTSTPVVLHTHSAFLADVSLKERTALRGVLLFETTLADAVIFVSPYERESLRTYVSPRPEQFVVENRVRLPSDTTCERPFPDLPEDFLLCVGTVIPRKGQPRVVEAMSSLPETHLALAGNVEMDISEVIESHGVSDRVSVLGRVTEQELHWLLEHASVLVHPAQYESYGLVIAEALAHGTPVVCSEGCGAKVEINEANGRIVSVDASPAELARVIETCLTLNPDSVCSVADVESFIDKFENIYNAVVIEPNHE